MFWKVASEKVVEQSMLIFSFVFYTNKNNRRDQIKNKNIYPTEENNIYIYIKRQKSMFYAEWWFSLNVRNALTVLVRDDDSNKYYSDDLVMVFDYVIEYIVEATDSWTDEQLHYEIVDHKWYKRRNLHRTMQKTKGVRYWQHRASMLVDVE